MIKVYADLVELGLRTLDPAVAQEKGIVLVPTFYRDKVVEELTRRGTTEGIYA